MRFEGIRVERFGPLSGLDLGRDGPLPPLVAVVGPNEAGKSAFHQLLATLLYGFYPAGRDGNPWAPWSGGDAEIQGTILLRDGGRMEVHRRLLAAPWGQLRQGDRVEEIRNQDLPFVRHVERDVFLQVYALTLAELAGLTGRGWETVQDRLLVGLGSRNLRSPREVIQHWDQEARRLWRSDRRSTRYREIVGRMRELRNEREAARERDRELRDARERITALTRTREELRTRRAEVDARLEGARRLAPLRVRLRRLEELRTRAGDPDDLAGLPGEPGERMTELRRRLAGAEEKLARVDRLLDEARGRSEGVTDRDRAVLERATRIRELSGLLPLLRERAARRGALDEEIRGLERRIREGAGPLFREGSPPPDGEALAAVPVPELERTLAGAGTVGDRMERIRDRIRFVEEAPLPSSSPARTIGGVLLLLLGLALAVFALLRPGVGGGTPSLIVGLALAAGGGLLLQRRWAARSALALRDREVAALRAQLDEAGRELERHMTRIRSLLTHLPLRDEVLDRPTQVVASGLARLRELVQDLEDRRAAREALDRSDRELAGKLDSLRAELIPDLPPEPAAALHFLGSALTRAEEAERTARQGRERLRELEEERETVAGEEEALRNELAALGEAVSRAAGGEDPDDPVVVEGVEERLRTLAVLGREEEELAREYPDLEALRERLEKEVEPERPDDERTAALEGEREALQEEMEEIRAELGALRERLQNLEREVTPDILDGELQLLEEELVRVRRERDRLLVLSRLLGRAEARFREKHQPDLLRRAEDHLARITGGRYSRLVLEDGPQGSVFHLHAPHLPHALPVTEPLSTGTREQVYLALRLAIVDHLDEGWEPLPLFLDEVLVNWDAERRARGLDVLADMADRRQVFLFTCHPGLAREVEERGGKVVALEGP